MILPGQSSLLTLWQSSKRISCRYGAGIVSTGGRLPSSCRLIFFIGSVGGFGSIRSLPNASSGPATWIALGISDLVSLVAAFLAGVFFAAGLAAAFAGVFFAAGFAADQLRYWCIGSTFSDRKLPAYLRRETLGPNFWPYIFAPNNDEAAA